MGLSLGLDGLLLSGNRRGGTSIPVNPFSDNFTRANAASLGVATPGGFTWLVVGGATGISGNKAQGAGSNDVAFTSSTNQTVTATFLGDLTNFSNLYAFGDGTGANRCGAGINADGSIAMFTITSGTFNGTFTGNVSAAGVLSPGVPAVIQFVLTPSLASVFVGGVLACSTNGLSGRSGAFAGFELAGATDSLSAFAIT